MRTWMISAIALLIGNVNPVLSAAGDSPRPPWEGQYKIKPGQTDRLTPADVVGPDGIVYPNWTRTGVQGGIPDVAVVANIDEFGGKADDDKDDSAALDAACRAAGRKGGGAVLLDEGTYYLDRPVTIRHNNVVIRGRGAEKTLIVFRYALPDKGIRFYSPMADDRVGPNTQIELHARPQGLQRMEIQAGDETIATWTRGAHSGNSFSFSTTGRRLLEKVDEGPVILTGIAEYENDRIETTVSVVADPGRNDHEPPPETVGAITFAGARRTGRERRLARDGKRGDLTLTLENAGGLQAGDRLIIEGPATDRWKALTQNACRWGQYRMYAAEIAAVDGNRVTLTQPLRIEFPTVDGSFVEKIDPIRRCGIEDLSIEQTENLWISTVIFQNAWNCWARGVTVRMCGRFPVYGLSAKWCEIRDCTFDDAWFKGGGGTAYVGWQTSWDCLMENVETFKMRHAPLYQWAASGNVIRKSVFHESDGQWHAGWTNENLFEQCVIESVQDHGAYGYGFWASPPEDQAHGPNGPRNVVYNCNVISPREGLWMGGMNENWLILHNRFLVGKGPGVLARMSSFDHIIQNNIFVLYDPNAPMVRLQTADCIGVEVLDNTLLGGNGEYVAGPAEPAVVRGNKTISGDVPEPPKPEVPSIYEWQQREAGGAK